MNYPLVYKPRLVCRRYPYPQTVNSVIVTALERQPRKRVLKEISNEQLMTLYSKGNSDAFAELYRRNKSALFRYFLRQTRNNGTAEELSQDVWTNVVRAHRNYKATAKFTTYLYQIAHNRLVDHIRRSNTQAIDSHHDPVEDCESEHNSDRPDQQAESLQASQRLLELLQQLPPEQREAFILKEEAGLGLNEIAAVTGVNAETAKSRLRYAVSKLKQGMLDYL